jgi:hypothetical protein
MLVVTETVRSLLSLYPPSFHAEIEASLPSLSLQAQRLAMEVESAELEGIPYAEAVDRPDYPLMGRLHYGVRDLLQWHVPPAIREIFEALGRRAAEGGFDSLRRSLFAAARRNDKESAVMRFVFYEMIGMNLLLATWDNPGVEVSGSLDRVQADVQQQLEARLAMPEMHEADVRPLHVLVAEAMWRLHEDAENSSRFQLEETIAELVEIAQTTQIMRSLEAPDAAALRIGRDDETLGSQRIADRYPWHFPSRNSVDQRRARLGKKFRKEGALALSAEGVRVVDIMRGTSKKESSQ